MSRTGLVFLFLFVGSVVYCQDISHGQIVINGQPADIRFLNVGKESFISWSDLNRLLPGIFSLSEKGEIVVNPLLTNPALLRALLSTSAPAPTPSGAAIESRIDGEFDGWDGETIFKLQNGQIWQQSEYAYTYHYAYSPEVLIYPSGGGWKMKVDGVSSEIRVQRLK